MSSKPKVLVSLLDEGQEFQRLQAQDALDAAARTGLDAEVVFAENTAILQIQQLYKAIHAPAGERPKVILIQSVPGEGQERVAKAAVRAGIGWVLINREVEYLGRLRREYPKLPIASVNADQVEIGRIQGRQFRKLLPGGGVVLYVQGPADTSAARDRLAGASSELQGTGIELKVIEGQWTEQSGEQVVDRWIRLKRYEKVRPDLVGCQNDAMAIGARRALAADPAFADLRLTGVDGLPSGGQRLVRSGELAATVIVPPTTGPAMRLVAEFLSKGSRPPEQVQLQPTPFPGVEELGPIPASRQVG